MAVSFNGKHLAKFIRPEEYERNLSARSRLAHKQLETKTGVGNDFWVGWTCLYYDKGKFARIKEAAQKIRSDSDVLLVAGIGGGSYLDARAVVEAVKGPVSQRGRWRPEDLLLRQHHQPHRAERYHQADERGKRFPSTLSPSPAPPPRRPLPSACCASCWKILSVSREANKAHLRHHRPR